MTEATSKSLFSGYGKLTIAAIVSYHNVAETLRNVAKGSNIVVHEYIKPTVTAVEIANHIAPQTDVIVSSGGTAFFLMEASSIPVVQIDFSPLDIINSANSLPRNIRKVGYICFGRPVLDMESVKNLTDKTINQYIYGANRVKYDNDEIVRAIMNARKDGCEAIIGGNVACSLASEQGLLAVETQLCEESACQALLKAYEVHNAYIGERRRLQFISAALDSINEGICVSDEDDVIYTINDAAISMFGGKASHYLGKKLDAIPLEVMHEKNSPTHSEKDRLETLRDVTLNINKHPIKLDNNYIGTISTFEDVSRIQLLEGMIRKNLGKKGFSSKYHFDDIITIDSHMKMLKKMAELYASTDSPVLIEGESGTGKELIAGSIHNASRRSVGPFVSINCGAIPENLLESELFGYAPGAFTGAAKEGKAGVFEMANNGTIFLDEISEMPKDLQNRLLRVLQEKEVMRIGDNKITPINCRVISATNQNLEKLVDKGAFRADLYYRLAILKLDIPSLRMRSDDIEPLSRFFLSDKNKWGLSEETTKHIISQLLDMNYDWPGNIRELENICTRAAILFSLGEQASVNDIAAVLPRHEKLSEGNIRLNLSDKLTLQDMVREAERQYITAILKQNNNNQSKTAKQLDIGRTTLWRKLDKEE
ncbi:MAG: sigma 54-interacting transcriptional regulator [Mogibacterium sp.]|nr:sigma 54-interacting transcriptional regulator [Mogibacterium sp.]